MKTRTCTVRHANAQTRNNCDICGPKQGRGASLGEQMLARTNFISAPPSSQARGRLEEQVQARATFLTPRDPAAEREEDLNDAREYVVTTVGNEWDNRWDKVMGPGTAQTAANVRKYREAMGAIVDSDPARGEHVERHAAALTELREPARAFRAGEEHPYDEHFEDIWEGRTGGFSEEDTIRSLASNEKTLEGLHAGTVKPSTVVGRGQYRNPRKVAREYLEKSIASDKEALETRGRSHSVNFSNARGRYRSAENN